MSEFDMIRRRQQGTAAKERVLSRLSHPQDNNQTSEFAAIRNRPNPTDTAISQLQANADRADVNLSPIESAKLRQTSPDVKQTSKPLYKKILGGIKSVADKTGVTKDLGYLADAAGSVMNAPGDLIRTVANHTNDINNALYNNPVFHAIDKVLPHAPAGQKVFADGGTVGQHLQQASKKLDIPGVTTGPVANFIRGAADTMDFGTGKALDQALGNTDAIAGRNTTAAKAGEITSIAASLVQGGYPLIKKALEKFASRSRVLAPEAAQKVTDLLALPEPKARGNVNTAQTPDVIQGTGNIYKPEPLALPAGNVVRSTRLKVADNNTVLNSVMTRIKPIVTERMTPPLENQNELAKWVQNHLGDSTISLNEVRKLPYEDLRQMSEMMRTRLNVADEAHKAASELGYNLDKLLNGKLPSLSQRVAKDAQKMTYGIYPQVLPKIKTPEFNSQVMSGAAAPVERVGRAPGVGVTKFNEPTNMPQVENQAAQINTPMGDTLPSSTATNGTQVQSPSNLLPQVAKSEMQTVKTPDVLSSAQNDAGMLPNVGTPQLDTVGANPHVIPAQSTASNMEPLRISPFGKKGKFTNPEDTRTYIATNTDRQPIDIGAAANKFYEKSVDNIQRINQLDKYVEKQTGKKLSPDDRAYYHALNSRGSDMISKHIITERLVDSQGNVIGESLQDISKQIPKDSVSYTNFNDYLIAKHGETRMARGETVYDPRTNMTLDKVAQKIAGYEQSNPEFKAIAEQLYAWNQKLGKAWLVDTGIISPKMWEQWNKANPYWIPNKRLFSKLEKPKMRGGVKRGYAGQTNPVKKYSPNGSERPIIDPFESLIEYVDKYVKTAKRNEVMQTVIRNLQKYPGELDGFAKLLPEQDFAAQKSIKGMNEILSSDGIEGLIAKLDEDFNILYNAPAKQRINDKGNILTGLVNGNPVPIEITDPSLLDAMTNLTPQGRSVAIELARKATNVTKLLTTGINPVFSLTRNIFVDIPAAYVFSKTTNNPFVFAWDLLDGVVSSFGNRELYKRYKAVGGGHSSPVAADRNLLIQSKSAILPQYKKGLGLLPRMKHGLENLSNVVETAPRLGEFKRITKAGGDSYASRVKGLYEANDVTINFKRFGSLTKEADAVFMYLNAAVEGLDKFVRAFKDNPGAVAGKAALAISVPTIALYAINHNNPDYQKLSNYIKDTNFLIPTGNKDHPFIKIPKSRELGVPFGSLLERTMRAWFEKDPESFRDFSDSVSNAFAPPGIPAKELAHGDFMGAAIAPVRDTLAGPIVDVAANKNFAGAPIVPGYLANVSPSLQYDASTSEVAKKIGDVLKVSPKQVDHLIRSYTGVLGQVGIPATTQGATLGDTVAKQVTANPTFSNDASRNFYDLKTQIDTTYQDIKATGVVPQGYDDSIRTYLGQAANSISDVTKAIRAVDKMPLTGKQKKEKKAELTNMRNDLATQAYQAVKKVIKK